MKDYPINETSLPDANAVARPDASGAMKKLVGSALAGFTLLMLTLFFSTPAMSQLIISQYVETDSGTTPKGIELWNQSGATIDFSVNPLVVLKGTNGGALAADATVTSGSLPDGAVMVIGTADMGTYLVNNGLGSVLFVEKAFTFNGDDALQVELNSVVQDVFGTPGSDPGSAWTGGGVSTANQNIALLCDITTGNTSGWTDPSLRFETIGGGTDLTGFGVAPLPCGGPVCSIDNISFANLSACDPLDNSYTVEITVEYTNAPTGDLSVNGELFAVSGSPQTVQISGVSDGQDVDVVAFFADNPGCSSTAAALFTAPASCQATNEQGLIISQYIETNSGSVPKGIELWNQTGGAIDFSLQPLEIQQGTNGAAPSTIVSVTSGILGDGEVMVIGTSDMQSYLIGQGLGSVLYQSFGFTFNGDDALVVVLNGVVEDTFGTPGVDAGLAWTGGGVSTANTNIQLLCDITTGAPAGWSDPSLRFETVAVGTDLTGFGVAPQPCGGPACSIDNVSFGNISACDAQDNSYTVDITVTYSNDPGGNLIVNGEVFAVTGSPQTVQLTLDSDGLDVDVDVAFSLDPLCSSSNPALFTAPAPCVIPDPVCGNESFTNMGAGNSGSYQTYNWLGDDGFEYVSTDSRNDQTINGRAALVRNGSLTALQVSGGIGDLTLTTQRIFSGGSGVLTVSVNGAVVGTIPYDATVQTSTIENINVPVNADIEISTPGNGDRVAMDDLTWTCFVAPGINLTAISGDTDENGATATFDVSLTEAPLSPVVLIVSSADLTENTVSPGVLNFDGSNWDIPQNVNVTGVADGVFDGDQTTTITVSVDDANSDPAYAGLSNSLDVINIDVDACDAPVWEVVNVITNSSFNNGGAWTPISGGFSSNGFCGGSCQENVDTWLIYGPLDLSATTSLNLLFDAAENFGTTDLVIQYSADYASNPCPALASWNGETAVSAPGAIDIDLSSAAGLSEVFIGIAYTDDGLDGYSSWSLTNFEIIADVCPVIGSPVVSDCTPPAPANNDCVDAQNLPVSAWPASTNSLGSVYGAIDSGSSACAAATGGDVFYAFTATSTNHHIVTVNPFGGFDAVVQVLDACGGAEVACFNNAGAGGVETDLLLDLPAGDYVVRVQNAAGTFGLGEAALGNFLIGVQSFPTAKVQDNPANILYACNQSGFQLEDIIGATPQTTPWVLDYEWLIAEVGAGTSNIWQRGEPNYSAIINWLGMEYGKLYNVYVRVLVDHPVFGPTWGVFQVDGANPNAPGASECTVEMSSNVTPTELRPNYTPTNAQGNFYRLCDLAVAFNVYEAEDFRWRFDPDTDPLNGNEIIYQRNAPNPGVRLSWVGGLIPGNTYNVAVEVQVGGDWSGYSTVLPITLALPPNDVEVRSQYCGITYPSASGVILAQSVCAADSYEWEFDGPTLSTATTGNYALNIGAASVQPALQPGVYNVRVKVTQEGIPGDFGPVCVITIGGPGAPGDAPSALRELAENSATLFPNPNAGDEVRMELDGLSDGNHEVMIQIYDSYGKLIQTEGFGHTGTNLSRVVRFNSELATGMYLVQIAVDGERYATERLIVK